MKLPDAKSPKPRRRFVRFVVGRGNFHPAVSVAKKPDATEQGQVFNRMVSSNGESTTRVSKSVYADSYWMTGRPGVTVLFAIVGPILGMVTRINYRFLLERQLIYLPVIFLGMNMAATGPMAYLQKNFVGALPIFLGYLFIIFLLQRATRAVKVAAKGTPLIINRAKSHTL
jgi:hypothetical protein